MSSSRIKRSAEEVLRSLENDPAHMQRQSNLARSQELHIAQHLSAVAPVVADLRRLGFDVGSVQELYQRRIDYRAAVPVLLHWLPQVSNESVKETIIRALSVRWARRIATPALIREYDRQVDRPAGIKWAIGNALSVVADDSDIQEVIRLVRDVKNGKSREMVALALGNMQNPMAVDVLIDLLADEEICGHAIMALGRLKAKKARSLIETFQGHTKPWIRTEAKRALAKIDRAC